MRTPVAPAFPKPKKRAAHDPCQRLGRTAALCQNPGILRFLVGGSSPSCERSKLRQFCATNAGRDLGMNYSLWSTLVNDISPRPIVDFRRAALIVVQQGHAAAATHPTKSMMPVWVKP